MLIKKKTRLYFLDEMSLNTRKKYQIKLTRRSVYEVFSMHLKKHVESWSTSSKLLIQLSFTYSYSKCSTRLNHLVYVIDNVSSLEQKLPLSPAFLPSKLSSSSILNMKLCESYTISICFFSALVLFKIQNKCFHFGAKIKNYDCFFNYFKN